MKATTMTKATIENITGIATDTVAVDEINEALANGAEYGWEISSITLSNNPKPMRMTSTQAEAIITAYNEMAAQEEAEVETTEETENMETTKVATTEELEAKLESLKARYEEKFAMDFETGEAKINTEVSSETSTTLTEAKADADSKFAEFKVADEAYREEGISHAEIMARKPIADAAFAAYKVARDYYRSL